MQETIFFNLNIHIFFSIFLAIFLFIELILVFLKDSDKFIYLKRLMLFFPTFYGILSACIFSGILALAFLHFSLNTGVFIMIFASFIFIFLGIKTNKWIKKVRVLKNFKEFKAFAYKKIAFELIILALACFWNKI